MASLVLILGIFLICGLILGLCRIWFIVLGFQRHWAWGCGLLLPLAFSIGYFVAPAEQKLTLATSVGIVSTIGGIVLIAFIIVGWPATKSPFYWSLGSTLVLLLTIYGTLVYAASQVPQLKAALQARGFSTDTIERLMSWRPDSGVRTSSTKPPRRGLPRQESEDPGVPPPPAVFKSRLPPPLVKQLGEKEPAQPGIYYLLDHVSTRTPNGIHHGLPGEKVILLERRSGGKMLVTLATPQVGHPDFEVKAAQLTDDVEVARDAERRDFVERGGKL